MKEKVSQLNVFERLSSPTPKFFQILRNLGAILTVIAGAILASQQALPDYYESNKIILDIASYCLTAGAIISAVSQMTVDDDQFKINVEQKKLMESQSTL